MLFSGLALTSGAAQTMLHPSSTLPANRSSVYWAGALVLFAALAAYLNSLSGPLLLDDSLAITNNPSIRQLWPLGPVLAPPAECTVAGRPLANLSFALNYAVHGPAVRGYHLVNLGLHAGAALLFFGVMRRSFGRAYATEERSTPFEQRLAAASVPIAAGVATVWAVHPLLTASVSYISQRTELMMGFFYLLTFHAFLRAASARRALGWGAVSVLACWMGIMSKEGMVTAPVLVLIYDACFLAGSFRAALARRWMYYSAMAASWVLLGFLLAGLQHRAVGFGLGVTWWRYALTECEAVITYLRLIVWPHPLIFDYGAQFLEAPFKDAAFAAMLVGWVTGTVYIFWRWPKWGFGLVAFLVVLAPTSSVVPVATQPIAENRVYLAAAPMLALMGAGLFALLGRRLWAVGLAAMVGLGFLTVQRNGVFQSKLRLWHDTAEKRPTNPRTYANLGETYFEMGQITEARTQFERALRLKPDFAETLNNLGVISHRLGDPGEAVRYFAESVRVKPDYVSARNNLGNALLQAGRLPEAQAHFEEALRLSQDPNRVVPDLPELHNSLGNVFLYQGKAAEALAQYETSLRLRPDYPQGLMNAGVALRLLGRLKEAGGQFEAALRLRPDFPEAHLNLGIALLQLGELSSGQRHLEAAAQLKPDFTAAHQALGDLAFQQGRHEAAHGHYGTALQLKPGDDYLQQRWRMTEKK